MHSFVQVAEEYRLVPDTLYLTVNYIDRFFSDNKINRQRLQLLGVACMLIAAFIFIYLHLLCIFILMVRILILLVQ
jgi:hypothetical protein